MAFAAAVCGKTFGAASANVPKKVTERPLARFAWICFPRVGSKESLVRLRSVIDDINARKGQIDFVVVTGDLTENGSQRQIEAYAEAFKACRVPTCHVPGLRDARWSDTAMMAYRRMIGPPYFRLDTEGVTALGISCAVPMRGGAGYFLPEITSWLREQVNKLASAKHPTLVFWADLSEAVSPANSWEVAAMLQRCYVPCVFIAKGTQFGRGAGWWGFPSLWGKALDGELSYLLVDVFHDRVAPSLVSVSAKTVQALPPIYNTPTKAPGFTVRGAPKSGPSSGVLSLDVETSRPFTRGFYRALTGWSRWHDIDGRGMQWSAKINTMLWPNGRTYILFRFIDSRNRMWHEVQDLDIENGYPHARWIVSVDGPVLGRPIADSESVYVATLSGSVWAFDRKTGETKWGPIALGGPAPGGLVEKDGILYVNCCDGNVYALNAKYGDVLWRFETGQALTSVPVIDKEQLFAGSGRGDVYGLDLEHCQLLWNPPSVGAMIETRPLTSEKGIFFGAWNGGFQAVDRQSGTIAWRWVTAASMFASPAAAWPVWTQGRIGLCSPLPTLAVLDSNTGKPIWSTDQPPAWESIGVSNDGKRLYVRSPNGTLFAVAVESGKPKVLWNRQLGEAWDVAPIMPVERDGTVYVGDSGGALYAVAASDGSLRWRYNVSSSPVTTPFPVGDDCVVVGAVSGTVVFVEGSAPKETTSVAP